MLDTHKELPLWFRNRVRTIMEHNNYPDDCLDVENCLSIGNWTPIDLILREWLNNGGGSAKGFLGIDTAECRRSFYYVVEHKDYFIKNNLVNKKAWNNSGFPLWDNYDF